MMHLKNSIGLYKQKEKTKKNPKKGGKYDDKKAKVEKVY
jgi:hypothetical protein